MSVAIIPVASLEENSVDVLFDISKELDTKYGNPEMQSDRLLAMLEEEGITYSFGQKHVPLDEIDLNVYHILVIWSPDGIYSSAEIDAVESFVLDGVTLIFAGISYFNTSYEVMDNVNELLSLFGIQIIKERVIDKTNYVGCHCGTTPIITVFAQNSYFYNIKELALSHTCYLETMDPAIVIAWGDNDAFIDSNNNEGYDSSEKKGAIPLIAQSNYGKGTVVVIPTEKTFERVSIARADNMKFATNLFADTVSAYSQNSNPNDTSTWLPYVGGVAVVLCFIGFVYVQKIRKEK